MGLINVQQKNCKINKKKSAIYSAQNTIFCPIGNVNKDGEKSPFPPLFPLLNGFSIKIDDQEGL